MIKLGSRWTAVDRAFIVTGLKEDEQGVWVYFKNEVTEQEYNCLQEAFVDRYDEDHTG